MPQTKTINSATLLQRKQAAQAIAMGYDDADVSTVLTNAAANGFVAGRLPSAGGVDAGAGHFEQMARPDLTQNKDRRLTEQEALNAIAQGVAAARSTDVFVNDAKGTTLILSVTNASKAVPANVRVISFWADIAFRWRLNVAADLTDGAYVNASDVVTISIDPQDTSAVSTLQAIALGAGTLTINFLFGTQVDINVGFGKVLRVRWLRAHPERKHIFRPKVELKSELQVRAAKAQGLLEERKQMRVDGFDTTQIEKDIDALGYAFEDEPTRDDFAYSYWRRK